MKKVFKFFAAALAIVAAVSCAKELSDNNTVQTPDQELVHKVFSASLNVNSGTKTTLNTKDNTVHWTEGDVIKVIPAGSAAGNDFSIVSIDGTFADFEGETVDANSYRAVYPAAAFHNSSSSDVFVFSNGTGSLNLQYAVENNFSIAANFNASSNFAVSSSSQDDHLFFNNINAYLKFNLSMDNASVVEVSSSRATGYQNEMLSSSKDLGGVLKCDVKNKISWVDSNEIITFKNADGSDLKSGVYYYVAIPAVEIENLNVVIKDKEGRQINSFTISKTLDALANNIYNLGTLEAAPAPDPAKIGDYFYSDGTYSTELDKSRTVVGVVFYVGNPTEDDTTLKKDFPNCVNGLVVGFTQNGNGEIFGTNKSSWESADFMSTIGIEYKSGSIIPREPGASLKTGYNNTAAFRAKDSGAFALTYCNNMPSVAFASTWFIPTVAEFDAMHESLAVINKSIEIVNGTKLSGFYSTTSEEYQDAQYIGRYNINEKRLGEQTKMQSGVVRPIFAF